MSEAIEKRQSLPEEALKLNKINLIEINKQIDRRQSKLSGPKQKVLKRIIPLLIGTSSFLAACQGSTSIAVIEEPTPVTQVAAIEKQIPKTETAETPLPIYIYQGEAHTYQGESAAIIERARQHFGVEILSPTAWQVEGKMVENLPWATRDIALVAEAVSQLPPAYRTSERAPIQILLLRLSGSAAEGSGGGYAQRNLILFTAENFLPDELMHDNAGKLYGYQRDHLRAIVVHEYTHSFIEAHPEVELNWIKQTGWVEKSDGNWMNLKPENLIHDGRADQYPGEDIAVSASLMLVNPNVLSEDRLNFFLTELHYSNWASVEAYRNR